MFSMEPAVKSPRGALPFVWAQADPARDWVVLNGASDDADVALVVAILTAENSGDWPPKSMSIVEAVDFLGASEGLVVDGGLLIRRDDFRLEPSCCGELSDWRGWDDLGPGALTPWMGHGPAPWVDTGGADVAVIYRDGGDENDRPTDSEHVRVSYAEIAAALAKAVGDLQGFQIRLEDWLARHAPGNTTFAARFWDAFVRPPARA